MNYLRYLAPLSLAFALACNGDDDSALESESGSESEIGSESESDGLPSIVEIAAGDENFSLLVEAVVAADLVETISGEGPFTVFAPPNAAFGALLDSNDAWNEIGDINIDLLRTVLLYHVIPGQITSDLVSDGAIVASASPNAWGHSMALFASVDNGVFINGAEVVTPDLMASNGVVHVVDKVILPPTIVDAVGFAGLTGLSTAIEASDATEVLVETLSGDGPFTVFAPENDAFDPIFDMEPEADLVTYVLQSHVVGGDAPVSSEALGNLPDGVETLSGEEITFDLEASPPTCTLGDNTAAIVGPDVHLVNGVVHVIDAVLLPPS